MSQILLAGDIGPGKGLGHRRRLEALAHALRARGANPELGTLADLRRSHAEAIVVDSYDVRADDRGQFDAPVIAAIDDLERDLAVDLVVDPNPGGDPAQSGSATRTLHGPRFAPLTPVPVGVRARSVSDVVRAVLVTAGASDSEGVGAAIASHLRKCLPATRVRLVTGPWSAPPPAGVETVIAPDGLFEYLADADLVVTAGGVTLLESLLLGRPTVVLATAHNQHRAIVGAKLAGAAVACPQDATPFDVAAIAADLAGQAGERRELSDAARAYVDGRGAQRIAEALLGLL